jgi:hypothetical protein
MTAERSVWVEAVKEALSPGSLFQVLGIMYLVIGFCVFVFVLSRYSWWRPRKPGDKRLWPRSENPQQGLKLFFVAGPLLGPIVVFAQLLLWPVWLLFLWAYQPETDRPEDDAR